MNAALREDAWGRSVTNAGQAGEEAPSSVGKGRWYNVVLAADRALGENEIRARLPAAWTIMSLRAAHDWDDPTGRTLGWEMLAMWQGDDALLPHVIRAGRLGYVSVTPVGGMITQDGWGRPV